MVLKLTLAAPHEAENQIEISLIQSFESLQPSLKPPFSLTIPKSDEYTQLNNAILHAILTQHKFAKTHIKHLHAIVTDGYAIFVNLLLKIVHNIYPKLVGSVKNQLCWVTDEMVRVSGIGYDVLLISLMRQIIGGDFSDDNLWLCNKLVKLLLDKWDSLLEEASHVLCSGLYVFLRVLADHCRLNGEKFESLKLLEVNFCVKIVREEFHLCLKIGRDFIRLLQDLVHVPEFKSIWKDLMLNPIRFNTLGFSSVSQIYCTRTSSRYALLRITPEMETQLRFLLTHVKFGHQKRHLMWFARKFLSEIDKEIVIVDIVRFICCAHHPPNEIIQSDVVPRWAVIGWLLTTCRRKNYIEANVKLALFYDWLFFDERMDNIMNIEPAILLMVHSIPQYVEMTNTLLEFLLLLLDNYDMEQKDFIAKGVSSAFRLLESKGVIQSLDVLTSCPTLSPSLKEGLSKLLLSCGIGKLGNSKEFLPVGKDQPPGLAALVPSSAIILPDQPGKQSSAEAALPKEGNLVSVENKSKTIPAKVVKQSVVVSKSKGTLEKSVQSSRSFADVGKLVEEILNKTSKLLVSEINEETIKTHGEQLGTTLSDKLQKNLSSDFKDLAMILKNTAYTKGFHAGNRQQPR